MSAAGRAVAGVLLLGLLAACTSAGDPGAEPAGTTAPDPAAAGEPAATDSERPADTDVVLARAGFDTEAGAVRGSGYVSPVVESGGTCTLELSRDGRTVAVSGPAEPDATTTVCGDLVVPAAEVGPGEWRAVLRYRSSGTSGASESLVVEVPE